MVSQSRSFARQKIECWKQENPHEIDEVPVQAGNFDAIGEAFGVSLPHLAAGSPEVGVDDHAADDVQPVQTGHGEVDRHECAGRRPYPVLEFMRVLKTLDYQEDYAAQDRHSHVRFILTEVFRLQRSPT